MAVLIQHRNQSTTPMNIPNYIQSSITNCHYSPNPLLTPQQLPKTVSSSQFHNPNYKNFDYSRNQDLSNTTTNLYATSSQHCTSSPKHLSLNSTMETNRIQQQQQKPSIDKLLETEIRRIVFNNIKDQQQEHKLNFISVCKTMNKTYENNDKLDVLINKFEKLEKQNINYQLCIDTIIEQQQKFGKQQQKIMININNFSKQLKKNNLKIIDLIEFEEKMMSKIDIIGNDQQYLFKIINDNNHVVDSIENKLDDLKSKFKYHQKDLKKINVDLNLLNKKLENITTEFNFIIDDNQNNSLSTSVALQRIKDEIKELKNTGNNKYLMNATNIIDEKQIDNNIIVNINNKLSELKNKLNSTESKINNFIGGINSSLHTINSSEKRDQKRSDICQNIMMSYLKEFKTNINNIDNNIIKFINGFSTDSKHSSQCITNNTINKLYESNISSLEHLNKFDNNIMNNQFELLNTKIDQLIYTEFNNDKILNTIGLLDDYDTLAKFNNKLFDKSVIIQNKNEFYCKNLGEIKDMINKTDCTSNDLIIKIDNCLDKNLNILTIISGDFIKIKLNKDYNSSELINVLFEGDKTNDNIYIPNVFGQLLKTIVQYMSYKYHNQNCDCNLDKGLLCEWDKNFMENILNDENCSVLMAKNAANYLGIKQLIKLLSKFNCEF